MTAIAIIVCAFYCHRFYSYLKLIVVTRRLNICKLNCHCSTENDTISDTVASWHGEKEFYKYSADTSVSSSGSNVTRCTTRYQCANYLQVGFFTAV